MLTFQLNSIIPDMSIGTIDFKPFYITFSDLGLVWGSECQRKSQSFDLSFFCIFFAEWIKIWCDDEVIQVEHCDTIFK